MTTSRYTNSKLQKSNNATRKREKCTGHHGHSTSLAKGDSANSKREKGHCAAFWVLSTQFHQFEMGDHVSIKLTLQENYTGHHQRLAWFNWVDSLGFNPS
ncbi:hypothetical protein SLA2020_010330 [Shorea laevis]